MPTRRVLVPLQRFTGCLVIVVLALVASCSGTSPVNSGQAPEQAAPIAQSSTPAPAGLAGLNLPSPADALRNAAMISTGLSCNGSEFIASLPNQNVATEGSLAVYSPQQSAGAGILSGAAFALYAFDLGSLPDYSASRIYVFQGGQRSAGTIRVYAGLGDPGRNRWNWVELMPEDAPEVHSWSWGETQHGPASSDPRGAGRTSPLQPVAIVVVGAPEDEEAAVLEAASLEIRLEDQPPAGGVVAFRKGWDGTVKGSTKFDDSCQVAMDGNGNFHTTYYDSSNGQLYHMLLQGRAWVTEAVDCDGDVGLSHDLAVSPDGGLFLPYADQDAFTGGLKSMAPDDLEQLIWSPRSNFETGIDEGGFPIEAGMHPSAAWDADGVPHIFYECATTGQIRHAWLPLGVPDWLHEYVSPEGSIAGRPVAVSWPGGVCCTYMAEGKLYVAQQDAGGWFSDEVADDVYNPVDPDSQIGFCSAAARDNTLVIAMACTGGERILKFDLPTRNLVPDQSQIFNNRPGGGAFIDMTLLGDGSVRIAQYNVIDRTIYFETGDIPDQEQFTALPAVQYPEGTDCDDLAFLVRDLRDGSIDGMDAVLVELSSSLSPVTGKTKKEFKGHVTLLK